METQIPQRAIAKSRGRDPKPPGLTPMPSSAWRYEDLTRQERLKRGFGLGSCIECVALGQQFRFLNNEKIHWGVFEPVNSS